MRYFQGFIVFFFVGLLAAIIFGSGDNYYRKTSEKVTFPIEIYLTFGLVGGLIGIGVGASWEEDDKRRLILEEERKNAFLIQEQIKVERQKKSEDLGVSLLNNTEYKDGRKWILETSWINPKTNNKNIIRTYFNKELNVTVTSLNTNILYKHTSTEGSKVFIEKCHSKYKYVIVNEIIDGTLNTI
jgi:hypothetical protein